MPVVNPGELAHAEQVMAAVDEHLGARLGKLADAARRYGDTMAFLALPLLVPDDARSRGDLLMAALWRLHRVTASNPETGE